MAGTLRSTLPAVPQPLAPASVAPTPELALQLVPSAECNVVADEDVQALEASLLDFNVDDDLEDLVPMPRRIARDVRRALTRTFAHRFRCPELLDSWLHLPHPRLGGATPMERLVEGDGRDVLRAAQGALYFRGALRQGLSVSETPVLRLLP